MANDIPAGYAPPPDLLAGRAILVTGAGQGLGRAVALEAAKCVKKQSEELFETVHQALYEAFFTESRNIADPAVVRDVVAATGADMARFDADGEAGIGRAAVLSDLEAAAAEHGVTAIPTVVVVETGRVLVGLAEAAAYRAAVEQAFA